MNSSGMKDPREPGEARWIRWEGRKLHLVTEVRYR